MANIPIEVVEDIFLRLPATKLVRCRLLSKPCLSLIDTPAFTASHLNRTLETGDHLMILLRGSRILRTLYLDSPDKLSDIPHPLQSNGSTEVFGSCNGLIGLLNSPRDLAILNPSTRKIHRLPCEPVDLPEHTVTPEDGFYGLGYDSVNDDYKVVRMIQSKRDRSNKTGYRVPFEIKVFSLKTNSWKKIYLLFEVLVVFTNPYYRLSYRRGNGALASNCLHWVLPRGNGMAFNTIARFDLASEELDVFNFPKELEWERNVDMGVLDGLLCLMCYHKFSHVDVWVLMEYQGYHTRAWTKMFTVPKPEGVESFELLRPMIYSKDRGKVLLEINNAMNLMWFDLESKGFTRVGIKDCDSSYSAEILVSSVVLGCNGDPRRAESRARADKVTHKRNREGDDFLSKGFKLKL